MFTAYQNKDKKTKLFEGKKKDVEKALIYLIQTRKKHGCYDGKERQKRNCFTCLQLTIKKYPQLNIADKNIFELLKISKDKKIREILDNNAGQTRLIKEDIELLTDTFKDKLDEDFYVVDKDGHIILSGEKIKLEKIEQRIPSKNDNKEYLYRRTFKIARLSLIAYDNPESLDIYLTISIGSKWVSIPFEFHEIKKIIAGFTKAHRRYKKQTTMKSKKKKRD